MSIDLRKLSRIMSYALRHKPWEFGLEPDAQGRVMIVDLIAGLERQHSKWKGLTRDDLTAANMKSNKKRFEITDDHICALYGHSYETGVVKSIEKPPVKLFHGTTLALRETIEAEGLKPMKRQFVHMSLDIETAMQVAKRHSKKIVLFIIDADNASKNGIKFYKGNDSTWLADLIPANYLSVHET